MVSSAFKWFLIFFVVALLVGLIILSQIDKGDWVIYLNQNRTAFLDLFFKNWTHLGDGLFVVLLVLSMAFFKYRYMVILAIIAATQGLVSAFLKLVVFDSSPRPKKYLAEIYELSFVPGVDVHSNHSFPSGHTMTAFSIAAFLALVTKKKWLGAIFFLYALLVGFSRNYLSQHFLEDIVVGSVIGVSLSFAIWKLFEKRSSQNWLGGNIIGK